MEKIAVAKLEELKKTNNHVASLNNFAKMKIDISSDDYAIDSTWYLIDGKVTLGKVTSNKGNEFLSNKVDLFVEAGDTFGVNEGYQFKVYEFDTDKNFVVGENNWYDSDSIYTASADGYFRFSVQSTGENTTAATIAENVIIMRSFDSVKRETAVNTETVKENTSKITAMQSFRGFDWDSFPQYKGYKKYIEPNIEYGSLSTADSTKGEEIDGSQRWRTGFITSDSDIKIYIPSGIYKRYFKYELDGTFVSFGSWTTGKIDGTYDKGYMHRFIFSATDWKSDIDVDELTKSVVIMTGELTSDSDNSEEENTEKLPSYFAEEVEDCRDKLEAECTEKAYVFGIVTDTHYTGKNYWGDTIKTIAAVNEAYPMDAVFHLGDITDGTLSAEVDKKLIREVRDGLLDVTSNSYILVGNHDGNDWYDTTEHTNRIRIGERYALFGRNVDEHVYKNGNSMYGYYDVPTMGLRVIMLDAMIDGDELYGQNANQTWGYTEEQVAWVKDVALKTDNQVIILSHMGVTKDYSAYIQQPINGVALRNAIEGFIANGGVVVGMFHGHTHWDFIGKYSEENGFYEISTDCARYRQPGTLTFTPPDGIVRSDREAGTLTQELWDIVVVKPLSRTVKMIRFGAGDDREFSY